MWHRRPASTARLSSAVALAACTALAGALDAGGAAGHARAGAAVLPTLTAAALQQPQMAPICGSKRMYGARVRSALAPRRRPGSRSRSV